MVVKHIELLSLDQSPINTGKNINYSIQTTSGMVAGALDLYTTNPMFYDLIPCVHYPEEKVVIKEEIHSTFYNEMKIPQWLLLAESSFRFWDNDEDALYDNI